MAGGNRFGWEAYTGLAYERIGTEFEDPDSPEAEACMQEAEEKGEVVLGRLDTWTTDE